MNERTKKVVAGIVLGTFTFGCATPVFASDEMTETLPVQPVLVEQIAEENHIITVYSEYEIVIESSVERGKITITLKALKTLIENNKGTIKDILVGLNIIQEKGFDNFYDKFMELLDKVFDTNDTIEGVFTDALVNLGVDETVASTAAKLLTHFLF